MNMIRSIMARRNVPKNLWPKEAKLPTYVLNKSHTLSVKDMTLEEAWSGVKHSVHHFKVFRCIYFMHVSNMERNKLDVKSIKCVHFGKSEESKTYKLYGLIDKKISISSDVAFEELKGYEWNKSRKKKNAEASSNVDSEEEND